MLKTELSWKRDQIDFYGTYWSPEVLPKAIICLVHGHGEHCNRYEHLAKVICENGFVLFAFDLRGHGKSTGKRGHTTSYEALMADMDELLNQAENVFPGIPKFLYGHSMGGNLAANYLLRRNPVIKGAVISAPWLRLAFKPNGFLIMLGRVFNSIWPGFSQKSNLDTKQLSRDRDVVTAYENDPLVHNKITARLAMEVMDAGELVIRDAGKITQHMLVMHGNADKITSHEATQEFAKNAVHSDLQLNIFRGFFHEIHNEPEKDQVFKVLVPWLNTHL